MKSTYKRIILSSSILLGLALLPISCGIICNDPCGCGDDIEVKDFSIESFEALTMEVNNGQQVSALETYPFDEIVKVLRIDEFQILASVENSSSGIPGFAFACSPRPIQSAENLEGIQIINLKEVTLSSGEILKVGDEISNFFEMNYYFSSGSQPIEEFLEGTLPMYADELFKLAWIYDPIDELSLQFTICLILESGREFSLENEVLNIR